MLLHVVGSFCTISETGQTFLSHVQTDATTPNIDGPTMLGAAGFELGFDHWGTICPLG